MIRARDDLDQQAQQFQRGQLVHHRRYDYRGVVVDTDASCQASKAWHEKNLTQPRRDQPWYHVLVDHAIHTTYVAHENLEPDTQGTPVVHPLLEVYFKGFEQGMHVRNDTLWQE